MPQYLIHAVNRLIVTKECLSTRRRGGIFQGCDGYQDLGGAFQWCHSMQDCTRGDTCGCVDHMRVTTIIMLCCHCVPDFVGRDIVPEVWETGLS